MDFRCRALIKFLLNKCLNFDEFLLLLFSHSTFLIVSFYPDAQLPEAVPLLDVHSVEVKQVPFRATDLKIEVLYQWKQSIGTAWESKFSTII